MEDGTVDIGPEFLEDKGEAIETDIGEPALPGLSPVTVLRRVIEIGDAGSRASANDFRRIEGLIAGIGSRNQHARKGIGGALGNSSATQRVLGGILVESRRQQELHP